MKDKIFLVPQDDISNKLSLPLIFPESSPIFSYILVWLFNYEYNLRSCWMLTSAISIADLTRGLIFCPAAVFCTVVFLTETFISSVPQAVINNGTAITAGPVSYRSHHNPLPPWFLTFRLLPHFRTSNKPKLTVNVAAKRFAFLAFSNFHFIFLRTMPLLSFQIVVRSTWAFVISC